MPTTPKRQTPTAEHRRLKAHERRKANWKQWGPYLAERAWGTVREDYSSDGNAWAFFPHEHARSRAYRWNEDGLAGFSDRNQILCFSLGLWNGKDPFLKERLFGLAGPEGNHGEDVKELYWYLDSTPTHSYARMRYRYPIDAYPYAQLIDENARRGYADPEFELSDTGLLDDNRFCDVTVTYAKAHEDDLLIEIEVHNRSAERTSITVVPQLWFRNTWSWGYDNGPQGDQTSMPEIRAGDHQLVAEHPTLGRYTLHWQGHVQPLLTNNDTNSENLFGKPSATRFTKDAFHRYIVDGDKDAVNPDQRGTKAGLQYTLKLPANETRSIKLRLTAQEAPRPFSGFVPTMKRRKAEADQFYNSVQHTNLSDNARAVQRQALAGMLWSKQLYYYNLRQWLHGDPGAPITRYHPRNHSWEHLDNFDVLSMPDTWEYPWYAVWDTAFHALPLAMVDVEFAKRQLLVMTREWYMHPNGQLPAYEWAFSDVNPPVHAWAALAVYRMEKQQGRPGDIRFLESLFHKLSLNFTWWVNRKDEHGSSLFSGGFLGLDNISIFDRSKEPPTGGLLNQADGTAWMGFFAASMLRIALELAEQNPAYQSMATKFFEHFLQIARAINGDDRSTGLWDEEDGFYYDRLDLRNGSTQPIKVRSLVGLMPMIASVIISDETATVSPDFDRRMHWLLDKYPDLTRNMANTDAPGRKKRHLLSFINESRLRRILAYLLDEDEFLSPFGIRSLSKMHERHPYTWDTDTGEHLSIGYEPGEGQTNLFGGNSNWRGPVWFPINYLLVLALRRYHRYYGKHFTIECPTGSGNLMTLDKVADEITRRLALLFGAANTLDARGDGAPDASHPAWCGTDAHLQSSHAEGLHLFYEYFNGDTGAGLGASHQTGWTGLIAMLLQQQATH